RDHHFYLIDLFSLNLDGVNQGRRRDDSRAVLIVMENGDFHRRLEMLFNIEAFRSLDIFEVDASERGLHHLYCQDQLVRVFRIQLEVEDVNIGELFEEHCLALHDGLSGKRADVAKAKYGSAVGHDRYQVTLCGVVEYLLGHAFDLPARVGDTWRVGHRKVSLRTTWFCGSDFYFSGSVFAVVIESVTFTNHSLLLSY